MQDSQGYHNVGIKGAYPIQHINKLEITHEIGDHFTLQLTGILKEEEAKDFINNVNQKDAIEISLQEEKVLFTGVPTEINVGFIKGINYIDLKCKSCTYDMDVIHYSRSFQDHKMTFDQLIKFIMSGYKEGDFTNTGAPDKSIETIRVQYKETDWEFLKRVASTIGTLVVPDITSAGPKFWFGLPKSKKTIEASPYEYTLKQKAESVDSICSGYREIEMQEYLNLGDTIIINKIPYIITKAFIKMENSILLYRYQIQRPDYIKVKTIANRRLQGISLPGKVIDVARNQLKVHLNIDMKQTVEEAHWFPYSPEANNVWYNMPHKETNINVYFPSTEEADAMSMTSTRGCGQEMQKNPNMSKPTEKIFETKWGKELKLKEDNINIDTGLMNIKLDESNIEVVSNDKIDIKTDTDINIGKTITKAIVNGKETEIIKKTKNISILTEALTTFKVSNTNSTVELDVNNKLSSQNIYFEGTVKSSMPMITSEGQQAQKQAQDEVKHDKEVKDRAIKGGGILLGAVLLAAVAVAVVVAAPAIAVGAGVCATYAAASVGVGLASAATLGTAVSAVATGAAVITGLGLGGMALSDGFEGGGDLYYASKGDTETRALNVARDYLFGGDAQAYENAKMGFMMLATLQLELAGPYMSANRTASSANKEALKNEETEESGSLTARGGKTTEEIFNELDDKVGEKVNDYLDKIHDKSNLDATRGNIGPAVAGNYNSKTGKTYFGINNQDGELPDVVHPFVYERTEGMPEKVLNSYKKTLGPGTHAECNALNESLIDEFKIANNIEGNVTQEMLNEQYDLLKDMDISHNYISVQNLQTYKSLPETGMPMPRCLHCQYITDGATIHPEMLKSEGLMKIRLEDLLNGN